MLTLKGAFSRTETNKQLWEVFRKECFLNGVLSGSEYPMMWGFGYETVNSYIRRFKKKEYKKPDTDNAALEWGTQTEQEVKNVLLKEFKVQKHDFKLPTEIYSAPGYTTIITPDGLIQNELGEYSIVEIKCPYYWKMSNREDKLENTVEKHKSKYPYGQEKYFLQAAYYSTIKDINSFIVAVHWKDDEKSVTGIFEYRNNTSLKSVIMSGARDFVELMEEVKKGTDKIFQVRQAKKDKIKKLMRDSFIGSDYINTENIIPPDSGQTHQGKNVEFLSPLDDVK